ncbi:protein of unknown function [Candidatus Bipolaricaulis anaerobius]|uniref:Uncharacterized protein n=1 Tax=Candidatus Bipolaricaulis anaerobius TaxID=2026885 RepID=A0A2X3K8G8_9BACT|nr:protein of unknown function [Candidatus Bipolaricaulis anaerobius]
MMNSLPQGARIIASTIASTLLAVNRAIGLGLEGELLDLRTAVRTGEPQMAHVVHLAPLVGHVASLPWADRELLEPTMAGVYTVSAHVPGLTSHPPRAAGPGRAGVDDGRSLRQPRPTVRQATPPLTGYTLPRGATPLQRTRAR